MFVSKLNLFRQYRSVVDRRYIVIYAIYFSFFLFIGPLEDILPLLFEAKGFGKATFGVFLSFHNGINIFLPGIIAYLASKFSSYKISLVAMLLSLVGALLIGCLPGNNFYLFLFAILLIAGRTVFNFSLGNSINYVLPEETRGKYFALRDLFLFGACAVGLFFGGAYIARYNISSFYKAAGIGFLIPFWIILKNNKLLQSSKNNRITKDSLSTWGSIKLTKKEIIGEIFRDRKVQAFIFIQIGTMIYSSAMRFLPLLGTDLGISVPMIMTMFGAITVVNSIIGLFLAHFSDTLGRKWLYIFDIGFDVLPAMVFAFTRSITIFIFGVILTMIKDIFAPISFAYFFDCFPEEKGIMIQGILSSVGNALNLLAPLFVGFLWVISPGYVFLLGAVGNGIAAVVAALMLPNVKVNDKESTLA